MLNTLGTDPVYKLGETTLERKIIYFPELTSSPVTLPLQKREGTCRDQALAELTKSIRQAEALAGRFLD